MIILMVLMAHLHVQTGWIAMVDIHCTQRVDCFFCDFSNAIHLLQTHSHVLIKKIKLVFVEFSFFFWKL